MIDEILLDKVKDEIFKKCEELYSKERNDLEDKYYKLCCKMHEGVNELLHVQSELYPDEELDKFIGEFLINECNVQDIPPLTKDIILQWHKEANKKREIVGKEPLELPSDEELERLAELTKLK